VSSIADLELRSDAWIGTGNATAWSAQSLAASGELFAVVVVWDAEQASWTGWLTTRDHRAASFSVTELDDPMLQPLLRKLPGWDPGALVRATMSPGIHLVWRRDEEDDEGDDEGDDQPPAAAADPRYAPSPGETWCAARDAAEHTCTGQIAELIATNQALREESSYLCSRLRQTRSALVAELQRTGALRGHRPAGSIPWLDPSAAGAP
jgi:hypothetical protein